MITNPFARTPKSPLDQALAVIDDIRAEAAETAVTIRDAAAKAADALGDPPVPGGRRLPALALLGAAGLGVALALRARAGKGSATPPPPPPQPSPAVVTAAKATAAAPAGASKPAAEVAPEKEQPKEPKAETEESEAAS